MILKIIVSHPGKQYVHRLLYSLQLKKYLCIFFTSVWNTKSPGVRWTQTLLPFTRSTFRKRSFELLDESKIETFFLPEFVRLVIGKVFPSKMDQWVFFVDRWHDRHVAKHLPKLEYDIFIGFENASLESFKTAKEQGKITILDLAQVHYSFIDTTRKKFPEFRNIVTDERWFEKMNFRKDQEIKHVDYFFSLSELARQSLISAGIQADRIFKLNLGVDVKLFSPKTSYHSEEFKLLFVGTVSKRKGVHLVIEAFKQLNLQKSSLTIVGPISDAKDCVESLPDCIQHIPFTDHNQLARYYQDASVFVFPSFLDSWAMVVVEAMACGTPVIISDHTGSKDAVEGGGGFVIPTGSIEALKEKILFFYNNRQQIELYGLKAREIAQEYTWEKYYANVHNAISNIQNRSAL